MVEKSFPSASACSSFQLEARGVLDVNASLSSPGKVAYPRVCGWGRRAGTNRWGQRARGREPGKAGNEGRLTRRGNPKRAGFGRGSVERDARDAGGAARGPRPPAPARAPPESHPARRRHPARDACRGVASRARDARGPRREIVARRLVRTRAPHSCAGFEKSSRRGFAREGRKHRDAAQLDAPGNVAANARTPIQRVVRGARASARDASRRGARAEKTSPGSQSLGLMGLGRVAHLRERRRGAARGRRGRGDPRARDLGQSLCDAAHGFRGKASACATLEVAAPPSPVGQSAGRSGGQEGEKNLPRADWVGRRC